MPHVPAETTEKQINDLVHYLLRLKGHQISKEAISLQKEKDSPEKEGL